MCIGEFGRRCGFLLARVASQSDYHREGGGGGGGGASGGSGGSGGWTVLKVL